MQEAVWRWLTLSAASPEARSFPLDVAGSTGGAVTYDRTPLTMTVRRSKAALAKRLRPKDRRGQGAGQRIFFLRPIRATEPRTCDTESK